MITDDAILVNMALDGKPEAFDELVRKHRSRVISTARMLVRTADGAEDVAQHVFVAAFANLRLLCDPASFHPWLMAITRRCASRQWTAQSRETTGLDEVVMASPYYQPVDDTEVRARIAEMLAELSALNRKIVVMHYLDGCSCREIGEKLGIPSGTVKRILHESRNSLRASSELRRGVGEMAQKSSGPRRMEWWIHGNNPGSVMDSALKQTICLTINKTGLTPEQIAKRIDANEVYVREALDALEAEELVEKIGRGRYRNAFVALGAEDWIDLSREISTKSERMADLLVEALPELQSAWERSPKPGQGFDWNAGIWPLLAVPVRLYGLPRNGSADIWAFPTPPVHPASGKSYWAKGIERVALELMPSHNMFSFSNWDSHFSGYRHAHFWSHGFPFAMYRDAPPEDRLRLFGAVASGFRDVDNITKAIDMDVVKVREAAAGAIELGLLEHTPYGLALTFPVFTDEDDTALIPAVDRVCRSLAEEADSLAKFADAKLRELGFGSCEEQFGMWRSYVIVIAVSESLHVLYNRGSLPHPGDPAPMNFCTVGWFDQTRLFSPRVSGKEQEN